MITDLYSETKALLDQSHETLRAISKNSGVSIHWLSKFKNEFYDNPGVRTVQQLHDYLKSAITQSAA